MVTRSDRTANQAAPLTLGGRFELGELLGRGGMGEVRAGRDLRLHRPVAVKMLHPDLAAQPMVRARFEAEARSAARLVHPRVVAVFDCGEDAGIPFLVMERLAGRTLADAIDEGPMDPGAVCTLGLQILDALGAAHAAGLIHRDIKPANVLAAGPGTWKVGDFGIAKSVDVTDPNLTATGLVIGTPAYLPPERLEGGEATASGDLYAVGVVLYQALVGRRGRDLATPLSAHWQPLPPLDQVRPGLPPFLVAAVTQATDPNPAARFASAGEMAARLAEPAPGATAAPTMAFAPSTVAATQIFGGPTALEALARRVSRAVRERRATLAAAAGLVLIVAVLAISLGSHQSTSTPGPTTGTTQPLAAQPAASPATSLPAPLSDALQRLEQAVRP